MIYAYLFFKTFHCEIRWTLATLISITFENVVFCCCLFCLLPTIILLSCLLIGEISYCMAIEYLFYLFIIFLFVSGSGCARTVSLFIQLGPVCDGQPLMIKTFFFFLPLIFLLLFFPPVVSLELPVSGHTNVHIQLHYSFDFFTLFPSPKKCGGIGGGGGGGGYILAVVRRMTRLYPSPHNPPHPVIMYM